MTELTEQDVAVLKMLNKLYPRGIDYSWHIVIKQAVVLARLAEADKWKKEIDELIISCNTEILEAQKHLSKPTDIRSIEEAEDVIFWVGGFRKSLVDLKVRLGGALLLKSILLLKSD